MNKIFSDPLRSGLSTLALAIPLAIGFSTHAMAQTAGGQSCDNSDTGDLRLARLFGGGNGKFVTVLAHRGLWGGNTPENSWLAVTDAQGACMDGVELDVKMTSDSVPVLMHDFNLGRTTNAWQSKDGEQKYNPEDNTGYNPLVSSLPAITVDRLRLLTVDRSGLADLSYVGRVQDVFNAWVSTYGALRGPPMVFDIKTAEAVRAVAAAANTAFASAGGRPQDVIAMKVNASLYTSRAAYDKDAGGSIKGIPIFVTNNISKIDVTQVMRAWYANPRDAIEVNVKQEGGILQGELDELKKNGIPRGVFNAIPDYPTPFNSTGGRFSDKDGHCCYTLQQKYFVDAKTGQKDTDDQRGSFDFLNNEGFTFITSDNPRDLIDFLGQKGKRQKN